jgi:hypothetical protein
MELPVQLVRQGRLCSFYPTILKLRSTQCRALLVLQAALAQAAQWGRLYS